jgi:hypothetical protein
VRGPGAPTLALVLLLAGATAARAQDSPPPPAPATPERPALTDRQREEERKAITAFAAGRFEDVVRIYSELYADFRDPIYLRNIGRGYQRLRQPDRAIAAFEEYLRKAKGLAPAERDEIQGFIAELEVLRKQQAPPAATAPPALAPPSAPTLTERLQPTPQKEAREQKGWSGQRWAAAGALAVAGGLAIGATALMSSSWSGYDKDKDGACAAAGPGSCIRAANSIASKNRISRLLFAGAGVAAIGGGILVYLDLSAGPRNQTAALVVGRTF